jgi:hypothetical protein
VIIGVDIVTIFRSFGSLPYWAARSLNDLISILALEISQALINIHSASSMPSNFLYELAPACGDPGLLEESKPIISPITLSTYSKALKQRSL